MLALDSDAAFGIYWKLLRSDGSKACAISQKADRSLAIPRLVKLILVLSVLVFGNVHLKIVAGFGIHAFVRFLQALAVLREVSVDGLEKLIG